MTAEVYSYEDQHDGFSTKRWQLFVGFGSPVVNGQAFAVIPTFTPGEDPAGRARVQMGEFPAVGGFREWSALGGSVDVLSRVGDRVTLALKDIRFQPATGGSGNTAMGSFTLDGQLTIANINRPLPDF